MILFLFLNFSVVLAEGPTSAIPNDGTYRAPCYLRQISTENVQSITINASTISLSQAEQIQGTAIPNGKEIQLNCSDKNYVFNPKDGSDGKSFKMKCQNGAFVRNNKTDFCDQKCNLLEIKKAGYEINGKESLSPLEKHTIFCPKGKTTRNGESFAIQCLDSGLLQANSPACFEKAKACEFGGKKFDQGSKLTCDGGGSIGLTIVSCNNAVWENKEVYNKVKNTCRETLADVNFSYTNLNEIGIETEETLVTIQEIADFCKANPKDPDCQITYPTCKFLGQKYEFDHQLILKCPYEENEEVIYRCLDDWIFMGLKSGEAPYKTIRIKDCGREVENCEDGKKDCEKIEILESTKPEKPEGQINYRSTTLKEYKATGK